VQVSGQVVLPTGFDHEISNGYQVVVAPLDGSELMDLMPLRDDASFAPAPDCVLRDPQERGDLLGGHAN